MINFSDCKMEKLEKQFGLKLHPLSPVLQTWLEGQAKIDEEERSFVLRLQHYLYQNVNVWNEQELAMHFIGPMFALVEFNYQNQFNLFAERSFSGTVDGKELGGRPDGMIATGYWEPEKPYFCFQEYKKDKDPDGDPQAQVLAAMLVAQEINEYKFPVYGCYVHGRYWYFMTLQGKEYAFSDGYAATKAEVFDILRILKVLKQIIIERVTGQSV